MPKTSVKAPKFVNDLYADLRDRRLLPLVALLLVAIIAAPILLKDKGESEPAAPPIAAAPQTQPSDASFAVVPAEQGLRDYHKRLGHRTARNPFAQPSAKASSSGGGESSGGGAASTEAASGSPEVTAGGGEAAPAPEVEAGGGSSSNPGSESGSGDESAGAPAPEAKPGSTPESTTSVIVEKEVTGYSIDAKIGFVGETKPTIGLPEMTKLPSPKEPIAVYLGVSKDKKGALFLLGSLVTAYYGGGHCTLDKQSCTVLELRPGKKATLVYGLEAKRYKISLEKIRPEITENESGSTVTKNPSH